MRTSIASALIFAALGIGLMSPAGATTARQPSNRSTARC